MQGDVIQRGDPSYAQIRPVWNRVVETEPALFALCETVEDVQMAIHTARKHDLPLSVRGGGHDWVGRALCHDGIVIDLTRMRGVEVDPQARTATIQGGATAGDLIDATSPHDLVAVTGTANMVGMTGLTLGGGYGPLTPQFGLALDNLLSAEVVLADGRRVRTDATENPDLFWALRGGGGNFGVVTSMRIRLHSIPQPLSGPIVFPWAQAESVLQGYAEVMASAPDELAATTGVTFGPNGSPLVFITPTWSGERSQGEQIVAQLQRLGTPILSKVNPASYGDVLRMGDAQFGNGRYYALRTRWQAAITPHFISAIIAAGNSSPSPLSVITVQSFHGYPTRVPLESTAFGLRQRHFLVLILAAWEQGAEDNDRMPTEWAQRLSQTLAPHSLPGGYSNLLEPDQHDQISFAYGSNAIRLNKLKGQLDPSGMFHSAIPLPG